MWNLRFQPCPPSSYRRGEKNIGLPGYNGTTGIMWEHRFYNFTDSIRVKSTHIYRSILPTLCATVLRVTYYEERGLNGGSEKGTLPSKSRFEGVESSRSVPSWWRKKRILDQARRTFFFAWRNEEKGEKEREREEEHEGNYTSSSAYRVISNKLDRSQGNGIIAKESSLRMRVAIKPTFSPKKSTNFQFRENE